MIKLTSRDIRSSAVGLCVIFTALFLLKATDSVRTFLNSRQQLEDEQQHLMAMYEEVKSIQQAIDLYKKDKEEVEKLLFSEKDVPSFLDGISKYAQDALVHITDMKTQKFEEVSVAVGLDSPPTKATTFKKSERASAEDQLRRSLTLTAMPIHVQVEGAYAALVEFLGYLEDFKQLLTINNIIIKSDDGYPRLRCAFTLKIYSLKNLAELTEK